MGRKKSNVKKVRQVIADSISQEALVKTKLAEYIAKQTGKPNDEKTFHLVPLDPNSNLLYIASDDSGELDLEYARADESCRMFDQWRGGDEPLPSLNDMRRDHPDELSEFTIKPCQRGFDITMPDYAPTCERVNEDGDVISYLYDEVLDLLGLDKKDFIVIWYEE